MDNNTIQRTENYDQFQFFNTNRDVNRGHVEALKEAFKSHGNLTVVQPILVNDHMVIIDGQHRFQAAKELELPVYFTMRPGLTVADARSMNILHRKWTVDDFAKSYAEAGDPSYKKYLTLREDYGFGHTITMMFALGTEHKGVFAEFRNGLFVLKDEAGARSRLDSLAEVAGHAPYVVRDKTFGLALLKVIQVPGFDLERLIRKINAVNSPVLRRMGSVDEYSRALEEIYNFQMGDSNRLKLY